MAKKRKKWQQSHITDLKRHNTMLQDCCKDYAKEARTLRRSIEVLKADLKDVTLLRRNMDGDYVRGIQLKQLNINVL